MERQNIQAMQALAFANDERTARKELRQRIGGATRDAAIDQFDAMIAEPVTHGSLQLRVAMLMIPGVGPVVARTVMRRARVTEDVRLRELGSREVDAVVRELRSWRERQIQRSA